MKPIKIGLAVAVGVYASLWLTQARAATVLNETWGTPAAGYGTGPYRATAAQISEPITGGMRIAAFSLTNCICYGSGHGKLFSGSILDGDTEIPFLFGVLTTLNPPGGKADWWGVTAALPTGYRWETGNGGWVAEGATDYAWIIRDSVTVAPHVPPVPLPASGLVLAAGLGMVWLLRRETRA